jgi:hypothetical protein
MWVLLVGACVRTEPAGPGVVAGPAVTAPGQVQLAYELTVATDLPTTLEVRISDDGAGVRVLRFSGAKVAHRVPLLGFRADAIHILTVRLTDAEGRVAEPPPLPLVVDPGPAAGLPVTTLLEADPARMEPGYTLMPAKRGDTAWILALDAEARVVYAQETSLEINAVTPTASGDLVMVDGVGVRQVDWLGRTVRRWIEAPSEPTDVAVPVGDFHHDVAPQPDGSFFGLSWTHTIVDGYPLTYQVPHRLAPAEIRNDEVVHVAADGRILGRWAMLDLLDPRHIGWDSLDPAPSGALDWVHANAVLYDAGSDEVTVSLRHQDAVVRFSAESGELRWILADPAGWPAALQPYVLAATEPFVRHTHQHAVEIDEDPGDGEGIVVRVFDNGNDNRSTPYWSSGEVEAYSRILEMRVDPAAMTVTPSAEYVETSTGSLYSGSLGNADRLPLTGNRLATWGTAPRVVEWSAEGDVVFDLRLANGWRVDRALRVPSLYGPGVVESRE